MMKSIFFFSWLCALLCNLLSTVFAVPVTAQTLEQQASLSDLIQEQVGGIPNPSPRAEPESASSEIEPLPSQESLFGRLSDDKAKLAGDKFAFYESAEKQAPAIVRSESPQTPNAGFQSMWVSDVYTWAAPNLHHQPLYFGEVNLERYGVGPHRIVHAPLSAAHFFANLAVLPYHVASSPPRNRLYTLGHYRPGARVPYRFHRAPFSVKGFIAQGTAAAGIVLIP